MPIENKKKGKKKKSGQTAYTGVGCAVRDGECTGNVRELGDEFVAGESSFPVHSSVSA